MLWKYKKSFCILCRPLWYLHLLPYMRRKNLFLLLWRREGCFQDTMPVATNLSLTAEKASGASIFSVGCNLLIFLLWGLWLEHLLSALNYDVELGTTESNSYTAAPSVCSLLFICTTINIGRPHHGPPRTMLGHEKTHNKTQICLNSTERDNGGIVAESKCNDTILLWYALALIHLQYNCCLAGLLKAPWYIKLLRKN